MKLNTIHHVAIIVSDYERAKEFYVGKLGFQVLRENYQARRGSYKLDLKAGDQELEVFYMPGAPKRVTNPEACGLRHLCFRVESVEEAVRELAALGIEATPIRLDDYTGEKLCFFFDRSSAGAARIVFRRSLAIVFLSARKFPETRSPAVPPPPAPGRNQK